VPVLDSQLRGHLIVKAYLTFVEMSLCANLVAASLVLWG